MPSKKNNSKEKAKPVEALSESEKNLDGELDNENFTKDLLKALAPPTFKSSIDYFAKSMEAFHESLPNQMGYLAYSRDRKSKRLVTLAKNYGNVVEATSDKPEEVNFPLHIASIANRFYRGVENLDRALELVPRSFLMTIVSQYDAFLSQLITAMYYAKPEMLSGSDKRLSFSELIDFGSIDKARSYIIEKEAEGLLRESHAKQFEILESKLNISLRKRLDIWPKFIEITERRNLFTHTDGIVSTQYIAVCKAHSVKFNDDIILGNKLKLSREYCTHAYEVLFEIGVKLGNTIWRKLLPDELEEADNSLNTICYDLLLRKEYKLAQSLLDYAVDLPNPFSEQYRRMFVINRAQAYKYDGKVELAKSIIDSEDWSSCSKVFEICLSALADDHKKTAKIMLSLKESPEIGKHGYLTWPIFKTFRESEEFIETYKLTFGEDYISSDAIENEILAKDIMEIKDQIRSKTSPKSKKASVKKE